jgi:hypothetical protein
MSRGHRRLAGQERLGEGDVDVPVSAVDRGPLPSSICRLYPTNRGEAEALIDMERFVNARAEDDYYWTLRDRFEHGSSALTAPLSWPS